MALRAISQLLYLQIIMFIVDSEYAQYILSLHIAGLCYKQQLDNYIYIYTSCDFLTNPFCHTSTKLPVNKRLRKFGYIQFIAKSSSTTQKSVCAKTSDLLEKSALIFLYSFYCYNILLNLIIKKVSPKIIVKNIKNQV